MESDVLVVGAGPVGLALACALLQHGLSVRLIDKAARPATTSRANFVHARGSEVLDRLDALGDLPQESVRAMTITTYAGDRPMMKIRVGDRAPDHVNLRVARKSVPACREGNQLVFTVETILDHEVVEIPSR